MIPRNPKHQIYKAAGIIFVLVIAALTVGWMIGRSGNKKAQSNITSSSTSNSTNSTGSGDVKSIVSYTLPDGWKEGTCSGAAGTIYVIPNGTSLDCSANPSAPIKIYIDPQNTTDCQQLNNVQNVRKHVCISLYIDGHKSLKASTEYPQSSSYSTDTTISDYYINTGKGVVKVEYTYGASNNFQTGFDQLATSIKVN